MMDKKTLERVFGAPLISHGFRKRSSSWYRQSEDVLQLVNLQISSYGMQFYVNICCVPAGMEVEEMPTPKEHKCPIRIRLDSAFPEQHQGIREVFDLELASISESERVELVTRYVDKFVLQFLAHMKDATSLRTAIQQGIFKQALVTLAARDYLGIPEQ